MQLSMHKYLSSFLAVSVAILFYIGILWVDGYVFAANTCAATQTGDWNASATWTSCGGTVPQIGDSVTIGGGYTVTIPSSHTINAVADITIQNTGVLEQANTLTQTISGTLLIESGGELTHSNNSTSHLYSVNFAAANVQVNSGGVIDVDGLGYDNGGTSSDGNGPGKGLFGNKQSSGGGHGGDGGDSPAVAGGTGYCDVTGPTTIGSGGGSDLGSSAADGGGLIVLNVSGTFTLNGTITADGNNAGTGDQSGGGAGGGINITAGTIAGTPQGVTLTGGSGGTFGSNNTGGGGGGCMSLTYTTDSSSSGLLDASSVTMNGGVGSYQHGGAGTYAVFNTAGEDTLYVVNNGTVGAGSSQGASSLTVDYLEVNNGGTYTVASGTTFILVSNTPILSGDSTGTLIVDDNGTFTPSTTVTFSSTTLQFHQSATWTNGASTNLTLVASTLDFRDFSTSTSALTLGTVTLNTGSTLTHGNNSTEQTHILNLAATTLTIDSGASIDVDGLGYDNGGATSNGNGPGAGLYGSGNPSSGAGHGGAGGGSSDGDAGGSAYCTTSSPATIGSGGGTEFAASAADGGGLVILDISGTFTLNGTITADGGDAGTVDQSGGGAGGGVKITAGSVAGSTPAITATGGAGGTWGGASGGSGGGGGGCVYIGYSSSNAVESGDVSLAGGSAGNANGSDGAYVTAVINTAPTVTNMTLTTSTDGSGNITIAAILDDADDDSLSLKVESKSGTCSAYSGQSTSTLSGTIQSTFGTPSVDNNAAYQISSAITSSGANTVTTTWQSATDFASGDGTYCVFLTPYDGSVAGTIVSSTVVLDNVNPTVPGALSVNTTSTASILFDFGSQSSDTNFQEYLIVYNTGSTEPILDSSDGEVNSDTESALSTATYNSESSITISSLATSTQYTFNIYAADSYYNSVSSTGPITLYTMADVAGTPTVGSPTATTLPITIDTATNPSSTTYAIFNATDSTYLDASGASVSSPVFQTSSTWDGISATGLSGNTAYQFSVIARNGDSVDAATSTASTAAYTLASVPTSVSATALSGDSISISWSGDGTTYTLNDTSSDIVTNISGTSYTISNLTCGTTKSYKVKAINGDSTETAYSSTVSVTTNSCAAGSVAPAPIAIPVVQNVDIISKTIDSHQDTTIHQPIMNVNFSAGSSVRFNVGNQSHSLSHVNTTGERGSFILRSSPIHFTLAVDEEKVFDTDNDGTPDVHVKALSRDKQNDTMKLAVTVLEELPLYVHDNKTRTTERDVIVRIGSIRDISQIAISEDKDFTNTNFVHYDDDKGVVYRLSQGAGLKKLYIRVRSKSTAMATLERSIYYQDVAAASEKITVPKDVQETTSNTYSFSRNLQVGDTGVDVQKLQEFLNLHTFTVADVGPGSPGNETRKFGSLTKRALIAFQNHYKNDVLIPVGLRSGTGYLGPSTREFIANVHKDQSMQGEKSATSVTAPAVQSIGVEDISAIFASGLYYGYVGTDVRRLQTLLATQADVYPEGIVSGYFGPKTLAAVKKFQLKYHVVDSEEDIGFGNVGPATRKKLRQIFGK